MAHDAANLHRSCGLWAVLCAELLNNQVPEVTCKGTLLGTPNREPQEYSRNIMEYKDPGIFLLYTHYILGVPGLGFPVESI